MKCSIVSQLEILQKRFEEIKKILDNPSIFSKKKYLCSLLKEYAHLSHVTNYFQCWINIKEDIHIAKCLLTDPEMRDQVYDELQKLISRKEYLEKKLQVLILPKNSDDERGCFLEIRAGVGGNEAALFAVDLFRMYSRFAEIRNWNMEIISISYAEYRGYKEIIAKISNEGAYGVMKFESGGHRVQRVPETESQGRIHTSNCTVVVMPEVKEEEIKDKINASDIRIDTFRSSGAGGQHVNTTDSAIRITHIPTGLVVECQDERSQHKNKWKALSVLGARLRAMEMQRKHQEEYSIRNSILVSGDRSDRVRTYNFPKKRVTDHRIGLTLYRLEEIIKGKLDLLIKPIMKEYKYNQHSEIYS